MSNYYWTDEIEALAQEFRVTSSRLRQAQIYRKLRPKLNIMAEAVLLTNIHGYNYSLKEEIMLDAQDYAVLQFIRLYNPQRKVSAFHFLNLVMKNRMLDNVNTSRTLNTEQWNSFEKIDDNPQSYEEIQEQPDDSPTITKEMILKRFTAIRSELIESPKKVNKHVPRGCIPFVESKIIYMSTAMEFINRFDVDNLNMKNLSEYIRNNSELKNKAVIDCGLDIFNMCADTEKNNNREINKKRSIVDDDYCPNRDLISFRMLRRKLLKKYDSGYVFW